MSTAPASSVRAGATPLRPGASWPDLSTSALETLQQAGIQCLEIRLWEVMKLPPAERLSACHRIVADARRLGLQIWSAHIPFGGTWDISLADEPHRTRMLADTAVALDLCRALSPRIAVIHASAEPITDTDRPQRLRASKAMLRQLAGDFAGIGVRLAVEVLPRTCLANCADEMLWLIDGVDPIGVCLDTNHLLKESHADFVRKVGSRIVTLHVSDYDGQDEKHWLPGEGTIDWPDLARRLLTAGYTGPFMYETTVHKDGTPVVPTELTGFLTRLQSGIQQEPRA